jgi:Protein of unknown function (DUF3224)
MHARGSFEVRMTPQAEADAADGSTLGRMALDKAYAGDLAGTGKGAMLSALTSVQGSAGYVAIERVSGTLHGRRGSFVLQHDGLMTRGARQLAIVVVPDSGSGELAGLAGRMDIQIADGRHSYTFDYELPAAG